LDEYRLEKFTPKAASLEEQWLGFLGEGDCAAGIIDMVLVARSESAAAAAR
jgi:hypothetical protein